MKNIILKIFLMRCSVSIKSFVNLLIIFLISICINTSAVAHVPGVSLSGFGTATVDGVLSPDEWDTAGTLDILVNIPPNLSPDAVPGKLFVMNDHTNLYLAVQIDFPVTITMPIEFTFDNDHGGGTFYSNGDDGVDFVAGVGSPPLFGFIDRFRTDAPPCPLPAIGCFFRDIDNGGTIDGVGAFSVQSGKSFIEISHPLDSNNDTQDFSLNVGDTIGFVLQINIGEDFSSRATTFVPSQTSENPSPDQSGDIIIADGFGPTGIDHFQCYKVGKSTKLNTRPEVDLEDQFVLMKDVKVDKKPKFFCAPVDIENEGVTDLEGSHLTCYKINGVIPKVKVTIDNQFGKGQIFRLSKGHLLCVPSEKVNVEPAGGDDDDEDDD
jgi:hypothetical protein